MRANEKEFVGPLAKLCDKFISWKRAGGLKYNAERAMLLRFDYFSCNYSFPQDTLPRDLVERWCLKREHEHPRTHCSRIRAVKLFSNKLLFFLPHNSFMKITPYPTEAQPKKTVHTFRVRGMLQLKMKGSVFTIINPQIAI